MDKEIRSREGFWKEVVGDLQKLLRVRQKLRRAPDEGGILHQAADNGIPAEELAPVETQRSRRCSGQNRKHGQPSPQGAIKRACGLTIFVSKCVLHKYWLPILLVPWWDLLPFGQAMGQCANAPIGGCPELLASQSVLARR